jgi:hypothetical protein
MIDRERSGRKASASAGIVDCELPAATFDSFVAAPWLGEARPFSSDAMRNEGCVLLGFLFG